MNKRQILASLNNIANTLDHSGFNREADTITKVMVKLAEEETESYGNEPAKKIIDDFVDQAKRNERYDPSILKMMNDRLEFNKHERMSEEKFRKMIGKNKEANSTRSMKKLAESENPDEDLLLERAIQTRVNQARKRFFASQPKSFFSKKDDVDSYRTLVLPLSEKLYNLIQGTDFSTDNTGWLRNKIEEILDENSDNFVFDKDNFLEVLKNYEHNLKWRENRNKFLKGQPFDAGLDEYGTI